MVLLDLNIFSLQKVGGISVVWAEYLKRFKSRSTLDFTLLLPDTDNEIARQCDFSDYNSERVPGRTSITKFLPYLRRGAPGEVLHTSYYQWYPFFRGTRIVTLHDFMHELYAPLKVKLLHNALKYLSLKSADVIVCISAATKDDLKRFYPELHQSKSVHVIENAASADYFPAATDERGRHLLWVAGRGGYKNFSYALDVLESLNRAGRKFELRVVGPPLNDEERSIAKDKGVQEQITVLSGLTTQRLRTVYSDAYALLYLSKYEGFGLPILEAQQCGCPVIVIDNPSSREVGQQSVLVLDSSHADNIHDLISTLDDNARRDDIVAAGFANAKRYDWDTSVDKLIAVYTRCLADNAGGNP
ncbi:MAG: glycosyltransferase family 4 protein [Gammaproteobacteria bacterium]